MSSAPDWVATESCPPPAELCPSSLRESCALEAHFLLFHLTMIFYSTPSELIFIYTIFLLIWRTAGGGLGFVLPLLDLCASGVSPDQQPCKIYLYQSLLISKYLHQSYVLITVFAYKTLKSCLENLWITGIACYFLLNRRIKFYYLIFWW